jgi:hypothetical protein
MAFLRDHLMRLPSADEINVYNSLDERTAVKNFLGKDLEQARQLFRENFLCYQEDLMFMGPRAFCFYVPAAIEYLRSTESDGYPDGVNSFCAILEARLDQDDAEIAAAKTVIREGIVAILENLDRYGCVIEIYGDVASRYRTLLARLGAQADRRATGQA